MSDYLIEQYNAKVSAIQDREATDLRAALEIYTAASNTILERSAMERVEAGVELAAAMNQRDHEYHNGRAAPIDHQASDRESEHCETADRLARDFTQPAMAEIDRRGDRIAFARAHDEAEECAGERAAAG